MTTTAFDSTFTDPQAGDTVKDFKGSAASAIRSAEIALAQAMHSVSEAIAS